MKHTKKGIYGITFKEYIAKTGDSFYARYNGDSIHEKQTYLMPKNYTCNSLSINDKKIA